MKQIILVSRIGDVGEFLKYTNDQTLDSLHLVCKNARLLIVNGFPLGLFKKNTEIINRLLELVNSNHFEKDFPTLVAYHYFNSLNDAIYSLFGADKWNSITARQYSSDGNEQANPMYAQILNPLGQSIQTNKPIDDYLNDLWKFYVRDIDNLKDELLENIHSGLLPDNLVPELIHFQHDYADFIGGLNNNLYQNENDAYRNLLIQFRDKLFPV
jgi:hypothetical protein